MKKYFITALTMFILLFTLSFPVSAAGTEETEVQTTQTQETAGTETGKAEKAMAAAIVVGVVATAGAVSMGWSITKSAEGIARQPEAEGKIRTTLMLGLVFIETAIIYALVVAILIIFVL